MKRAFGHDMALHRPQTMPRRLNVGIGALAEAKLFKARTLYTKWAKYWRDLPHVRKFYEAHLEGEQARLEHNPGWDSLVVVSL